MTLCRIDNMKWLTRIAIVLITLVVVNVVLQSAEIKQMFSFYDSTDLARSLSVPNTTAPSGTTSDTSSAKPKIAIISGFVTRQVGENAPRIKHFNYDHMVNKACYANLWGYDFIFNTSWGFDQNVGNRYWLEYGTWHRVPHMAAALPNYDWIVYADVDWYIRDLTIPLESFISDWELHGFRNVSVFLPVDTHGTHVFSAYVVMIRNNAFGRRLIHNWLRFADGMCERGNFDTNPGNYGWVDSDQPGIWYALAKTHADFAGNEWEAECVDGKIKTKRFMGPEMRAYFQKYGVKFGGNQGKDLYQIPKDQPILWSKIDNVTKGGLGIQQTYGFLANAHFPHAFAFHKKPQLQGQFKADVETCKRERGCYAYYDDAGIFQIGCNETFRLRSIQHHNMLEWNATS